MATKWLDKYHTGVLSVKNRIIEYLKNIKYYKADKSWDLQHTWDSLAFNLK